MSAKVGPLGTPRFVDIPAILFPNLYVPQHKFGKVQYGLAWTFGGTVSRSNAKTQFPPLITLDGAHVTPHHYHQLAELFAEADVRNVTRDSLFRDCPALVQVRDFDWAHEGPYGINTGTSMLLMQVRVELADLISGYEREIFRRTGGPDA